MIPRVVTALAAYDREIDRGQGVPEGPPLSLRLHAMHAALAATAVHHLTIAPVLAVQLREYADNPGYSHGDYADTMREAANVIELLIGVRVPL